MSTENAALSNLQPVPLPPPPLVRPLQAGDRDALVALIEGDGLFTPDEVAVAVELVDEALADPEGEYLVLVAVEAGRLAGYVCYGDTPMTEGTWDLFWIVTHARSRGRGVARALITRMEQDLRQRGARMVRVETSGGYGAANAFYQSLGYPVAARLRDFYRSGDDLVVLVKHL